MIKTIGNWLIFLHAILILSTPFDTIAGENQEGQATIEGQEVQAAAEVETTPPEELEITPDKVIDSNKAVSVDISGFGFGVGIGVNTLSKKTVDDAQIVNNVVRIESESKRTTQIWLEVHYSFGRQYSTYKCTAKKCLVYDIIEKKLKQIKEDDTYFKPKRFFHGPFFAINMSDTQSVINGAALGYMASWRKIDAKENPTGSFFNLGFGLSSTRIQELRGDLVDGQTVSAGTQVEYKNTDDLGFLVLFSVGL